MEGKIATAVAMNAGQATKIILALSVPAIPAYVREVLAKAVKEAVDGSTSKVAAARAGPQSCINIEVFIPQRHWAVAENPAIPFPILLCNMGWLMERLGLVHANEHTWVAVTAVLKLARMGGSITGPINPAECYQLGQRLKALVRLDAKRSPKPHHGKIKVFPETPEQLREQFPEIYALAYPNVDTFPHNGPCQCPLDATVLNYLKTKLPARQTHSSIRIYLPSLDGPVHGPTRFQSALQDADPSFVNLPGFQWCAPRGRPQSQERLAIENEPVLPPKLKELGNLGAQGSMQQEMASITGLAAEIQQQIIGTHHSKLPDGGREKDAKKAEEEAPPTVSEMVNKKKEKPLMKKRPAAHVAGPAKKQKVGGKKLLVPFPGVPKKPVEPMVYKEFRIYSDVSLQAWGVRKIGERKDKAASWKIDPEAAWQKVQDVLKDN